MEKRYLSLSAAVSYPNSGCETYHNPISTALISIDLIRFWSASFFSSLVYVSAVGTMRWSSSVFLLFLRRLRRLSLFVNPVSSSSSRPSALMSSSSKSVLSLGESESERSASDEYSSSPSSAMPCPEGRLLCFFESFLAGAEAPAREEERLRAWFCAACSFSIIVGTCGWMALAMGSGRATVMPSSLSMSDRELSEGRDGSVRRGNSFPGLRSGADGALFCAASQREIAESLRGCSSAEVMLGVPDPPDAR